MSLSRILAPFLVSDKEISEVSVSYPVKTARKLYSNFSFSPYLPIVSYDKNSGLYRCPGAKDKDDYGVVYEVTPRILMGVPVAEFMTEVLGKLPTGVTLEISYIGLKNITGMLENFKYFHQSENRLVLKATESFVEFLLQKTKENITPSMTASIKNVRVIFSARGSKKEVLEEFNMLLKNILSSNSFMPVHRTPEELKPIYYELCNGEIDPYKIPPYNDKTPFGRQCLSKHTKVNVHDDTIEFNGKHWIAMAPVSYPSYATIEDFGLKLGDYISPAMNINQFKDSFIVSTIYQKLNKSETDNVGRKQMALDSQKFPQMFTKFWKKKEEALAVKEKIDAGDPVLRFDMTILVSGNSRDKAHENATTVQSFWNKGGKTSSQILLDTIFGCPHIAFLQALPLGATDEHLFVTDNYWENFADEAAQFAPLEADWKGNGFNFLAISRRAGLAGIDFFNTDSSKNGYVIATSGAGKSVFMQYVSFYSYANGTQVFLIDIGGSYERICKELGGEYIEIDTDNPISFNPFWALKSEAQLQSSKPFLTDFIYMIGASLNTAESEKQQKFIKGKLEEIITSLYRDKGYEMEITDIRYHLEKSDDPRLHDFAQHLQPFCKGGIYGGFFCGAPTANFDNPYVVVEVGKVEEQAEIRDAIICLMIYYISEVVYGDKKEKENQRVQVIIDEAHKFLGKNARMDSFIDQAYRRYRKHNSSILMATQGFDDIYNATTGGLSAAGRTIINNSPWKVFLKQTDTSINLLVQSQLFGLSYLEEKIMRSIETKKGEYSEFLLINPHEQKIPYRLVIDKFFYYLTTTDPDDKALLKKVMKEHDCPVEDAIDIIVKQHKEK